jgi:peroxiredoxin
MIHKYFILFALFVVTMMLCLACAIEEAEEIPTGSIMVTAIDTSSVPSVPISGAEIFINDITANTITDVYPVFISNLEEGSYNIKVNPHNVFYSSSETIVEVVPNDTVVAELLFEYTAPVEITVNTKDDNGTVITDAAIILDGNFVTDNDIVVNTPATFQISAGNHFVSVFKSGYKTLLPTNIDMVYNPGSIVDTVFVLELGNIGSAVDEIPYDFELPDYNGNMMSIGMMRGNLTLINFWYLECPNCLEEFPDIQIAYEDYVSQGFRVLAINTGWSVAADDSEVGVAEFAELNGYTFPLLINKDNGSDICNGLYGLGYSAPISLFVDRTGVIRVVHNGLMTADELDGYIQDWINE